MSDVSSLFDPWQSATPPRFVGRDEELARLDRARLAGRSVSLVGDRRIGKSSLLRTYLELRGERGKTLLLDGQQREGHSLQDLMATITGGPGLADADDAADALTAWAERFGEPPLLLFDEFDKLPERVPARFFERLRAMLSDRRVVVVLATCRPLNEVYSELNRTSPFYNVTQGMRLGLLDDGGVVAFMKRIGEGVSREARNTLQAWCGGNPFYLSLLGHYLLDLGEENRERAVEQFRNEAENHLRDLYRSLSKGDQQRLRDAAAGKPCQKLTLKTRGLLVKGLPFGKVLQKFLEELD